MKANITARVSAHDFHVRVFQNLKYEGSGQFRLRV